MDQNFTSIQNISYPVGSAKQNLTHMTRQDEKLIGPNLFVSSGVSKINMLFFNKYDLLAGILPDLDQMGYSLDVLSTVTQHREEKNIYTGSDFTHVMFFIIHLTFGLIFYENIISMLNKLHFSSGSVCFIDLLNNSRLVHLLMFTIH